MPVTAAKIPAKKSYTFNWVYMIFMILFHGSLFFIPWTFHWGYLVATIALQALLAAWEFVSAITDCSPTRVLKHQKLSNIFGNTGVLSLQGDPSDVVATHRKHHHLADRAEDPHTPNKSFVESYVWIFMDPNEEFLQEDEGEIRKRSFEYNPTTDFWSVITSLFK